MHTADTIKSVKPPIRETSFAEPCNDFDNNCSLDFYNANKEPENNLRMFNDNRIVNSNRFLIVAYPAFLLISYMFIVLNVACLDVVGEESLNTATVVFNMNANESD